MKNTCCHGTRMLIFVVGVAFITLALAVGPVRAEPPIKESALPSISHSWDRNFPSASRFTVLTDFNGDAVRDNNTGLVWERAPAGSLTNWVSAAFGCVNKTVGGTKGWRLPSVAELASLIEPSLVEPFIPSSIFAGIQPAHYWSATLRVADPGFAWVVPFNSGGFVTGDVYSNSHNVWCVRGPMNCVAL